MFRFSVPLVAASTAVAVFLPGAAFSDTTLRFALPTSGSGDALAALAETYAAAQPDATIQVQRFPAGPGYGQGILTQLQSGAGPDMFFTNGGYGALESLLPLGRNGQLADLAGASWETLIPDAAHDAYYIGDALYGMPLSMVWVGGVYNPAVLEQLGIEYPHTEEALFDACATAKAQGLSFSTALGSSPYYFIETVAVTTGYKDTPDWNARREAGEVTFAGTPGWAEAIEMFARLDEADCYPEGFEATTISELFALLAGGRAASGLGPITLAGAVTRMNPDITLRMAPRAAGEDSVAVGFFNDAVSINAASGNIDAAKAFFQWLSEPEQQQLYGEMSGGTSLYDLAEGNFSPMVEGLGTYYAEGRFLPIPHVTWQRPQVLEALNRGGSAVVTGQMTIEQALADMDAAWDKN
ncbi:ABC transporter substrate-binding protein [Roseinatronobacter sp.]